MINIGIVDDHKLFLKSLSMLLLSSNHYKVVIEAANGMDLQEQMLQKKIVPDIMLIDVTMPVMDGIATAKWLKQTHPDVKLVALSMNESDTVVLNMIKAGCCAYFMKDTHPSELEKALDEIHAKGYYNADLSNINYRRLLLLNTEEKIVLSDREKEFLKHACSDLTYKEIAALMFLSERTVDNCREGLFEKLKVKSRVGLALEAVSKGLVTFPGQ